MTGVSDSSFSFVSYNHPPRQCAGGTHPTGMHSYWIKWPTLDDVIFSMETEITLLDFDPIDPPSDHLIGIRLPGYGM